MKKDTIIQNEYEGFKEILRYTQNDENGRSMVEMLGVLAIIGVLSIAGIAGYKTAMTKYRTNELLEEVTKRAVVVASKISLNGKKAPTTPSTELIDEFTDPKNYDFLVSKENDNQFNILVDTVDESVCTQMKSLIEMDSPIQWIDDDCTKLTFNNDLSGGEISGDSEPEPLKEDACTNSRGDFVGGKYCVFGTRSWQAAKETCDNLEGSKGMVSLSDFGCEAKTMSQCPSLPDEITSNFWLLDKQSDGWAFYAMASIKYIMNRGINEATLMAVCK